MSRSSTAMEGYWPVPTAERRHLLVLGGTSEARALAEILVARLGERLWVTSSLAGRTRRFAQPAGALRCGGFGGSAGLADYLRQTHIDLVIDATHPFASRISTAAEIACSALGLPLLALTRPRWTPQVGDRWFTVVDAAEAARLLPRLGRRAFLTIGRSGIGAFRALEDVYFLVRLIEPPPEPLPLRAHMLIFARGPFTEASERRIMADHGVDVLVTKASGGGATAAKLSAARALGIPVIMLARPERSRGDSVEGVEEALAWVERKLGELQEIGT